jgi:hypothetical protein
MKKTISRADYHPVAILLILLPTVIAITVVGLLATALIFIKNKQKKATPEEILVEHIIPLF